jgi:hypothetical protein
MSAGMKLFGGAESEKMATSMGLSIDTLHMIAFVEILAALLFFIPRTGVFGSMLLSAYLGGAITAHVLGHQPIMVPVVLQVVLFITALIRFPEMGHRLFGRRLPLPNNP